MLIGIPPILGPELLFALRSMGHGDEIALVDGNYPAQDHARRLVRADGHGILPLIAAILQVMPLDKLVPDPACRAAPGNDPARTSPWHQAVDDLIIRLAPGFSMTPLDGTQIYPRVRACHTVVATTEVALYANVILRKGTVVHASP